ncbi:MAG: hypothetical protein WCS69_10450 [Ignavibacteriaceae bacterium]
MKNSLYYFFVICCFLPGVLTAQENAPSMNFSIYGGAALPQGDFSGTTGDKAGYAKTGFCAMVEGAKSLNESVNWVSSISLALNSMDETTIENQMSGPSVSAGSYITTWAMTGVGFETVASPTVKIYGVAQLGLLLSSFPDVTISYGGVSVTQTTKMGTAFAFGFGAGVLINRFNIGLRYYTGEPEYEESASYGGISSTVKVKLPATILQLMVGFSL